MLKQRVNKMPSSVLDEHTGAHVAELFRAFSDTSRVRIMSALLDGEKNVNTLAELVGISESAVSHHMRGLRQTRIVTARRDGKEVYYSITDPHIVTLFKQGVEHIRDA
jgi:ArsR family transcriptional regulator, lead/cadmium/zinc/bismuth-responsive transcriptional repressor